MAKGKKGGKDKQSSESKEPKVSKDEKVDDTIPEPIPNQKRIKISILGYLNIAPIYSISNLTIEAKYMNISLGTSPQTGIIDDVFIPTIPAQHEFVFECDINSPNELDKLISNPVVLTVTEHPGDAEPAVLFNLNKPPPKTYSPKIIPLSANSAADLIEALGGKPIDRSTFAETESSEGSPKKVNKKGTKDSLKKSKSNQTKKESSKSLKSKKEKAPSKTKPEREQPRIAIEPCSVGSATLDLLPLFLGQKEIQENLIVHQSEQFLDDRIVPVNMLPRISVHVTIDEDEWIANTENANIFSVTVESVYNIPSIMNEEMKYTVSTILPSSPNKWEPVVIGGGSFKEKNDMNPFKLWPGLQYDGSFTNATKYRIDDCPETIKNKDDLKLEILNTDEPIVRWNILKRNYLTEEAIRELHMKIKKYRHIPLELYVTNAKEDSTEKEGSKTNPQDSKSKGKPKSDASSKATKAKKGKGGDKTKKESENYLHLMTAIDVSTLLYPGVKRCRIACPLNTYQENEILEKTGLENSYFMPKQEVPPESLARGKGKKESGKGTSKTSSKGKSKSSKSDKGSKKGKGDKEAAKDSNKTDLKPLLPPPPIPLEPSTPLYNEKGERTFIIIEIELFRPLMPKRELADLSEELSELLAPKLEIPKVVISSQLTKLHFTDTIKQLLEDLARQYQYYLKEKEQCKCPIQESGDSQMAFLTFLQKSGIYQTYLMSITKSASAIVNDEFIFNKTANYNSKEYQNFIASIYAFLIKQGNRVMNDFTGSNTKKIPISPLRKLDSLLLYAREATEIGADALANRYYLERICQDSENADCWFDYAVFQEEMGHKEKAIQCLLESLVIDCNHRYSLLMYGMCLAQKNLHREAETCLLTMILQNQCWVEGWGAVFLFYYEINNTEGADLAMEMANKYLHNPKDVNDYLQDVDDLAWTSSICPNTVFLRTAVLLLKMRLFSYAIKVLGFDKKKHSGICHYYTAVVMYYLQNYRSALAELEKARELYGPGYAVDSLAGHCYLALGKLEETEERYLRVLESYDRPEDMHLVFLCLALVWERLRDPQSARKLLLIVCKFSPTPYTWLSAGILFYRQNDLISSEQCLIQANLCDNRLSDVWGYLTLINLEKKCYAEAELSYNQAKKNNIDNEDLLTKNRKYLDNYYRKINYSTLS